MVKESNHVKTAISIFNTDFATGAIKERRAQQKAWSLTKSLQLKIRTVTIR